MKCFKQGHKLSMVLKTGFKLNIGNIWNNGIKLNIGNIWNNAIKLNIDITLKAVNTFVSLYQIKALTNNTKVITK